MIPGLADFGQDRLSRLLEGFRDLRVGVIGDFFLDKYLEVDPALEEPSLETGLPARQVVGIRHSPGAAGTVSRNLASLGPRAILAVGMVGEDGEGWELLRDLGRLGVDTRGMVCSPSIRTPTYLKPRDLHRPGLEGEHGRYDTKNRRPTPPELEGAILEALDRTLPDIDLLLVMDQVEDLDCGVLTRRVTGGLLERLGARPQLLAWADSRRRIRSFRGLILKMNQFELAARDKPLPGEAVDEADILGLLASTEKETGSTLFVTAAERGVFLRDGPDLLRAPGVRVSGPVDPTGAGDSFSAGASLALAAGASRLEAALLGNLVASVTVRVLGDTGAARPEDLAAALETWKEQNP